MIYLIFLLIIITVLLIYIFFQHKRLSSRLLKSEEKYLETYDKYSFFLKEYNSLKSTIRNTKFSNENEKKKKFTGKTALVGDYFLPSYNNTKLILEDLGFDVDIANSSQDIINKIKYGESYDIIFTNNIYRDGTGLECFKKLKEIKDFSIPVVILTVDKGKHNYFVNNIGFDAYIEKPMIKEDVIPILEKLLNHK